MCAAALELEGVKPAMVVFEPRLRVGFEFTNEATPEIFAVPLMISGAALVVVERMLPIGSLPGVPWMVTLPDMSMALLLATPKLKILAASSATAYSSCTSRWACVVLYRP